MEKNYYLGLDMGTNSVGWAVTDPNYNLMRAHGKTLWGVRLFEGGIVDNGKKSKSPNTIRRLSRLNRRRLNRRKWRIKVLQELFAEEVSKVDQGFYQRLKESRYYPDDKQDLNGNPTGIPYSLFADKDYTDEDYYKAFPSIYHLRKYLIETKETPDIRLVYLAIHHIMKYRGNFLLSGDISNVKSFRNVFDNMLKVLEEENLNFDSNFTDDNIKNIKAILCSKDKKTEKKNKLINELKLNSSNKFEKTLLGLIVGLKTKLSDVFIESELEGLDSISINFTDDKYDEYIEEIEDILGDKFVVIAAAKAVYDWSVLVEILGDNDYLSFAKVSVYEKHKYDLRYLKDLIKENFSGDELKIKYRRIFVDTEASLKNYPAYIGMTKKNGKKVPLAGKKCSWNDFKSFLNNEIIKAIDDSEKVEYLKEELEKETFLPKQVNKKNGVIPYQVHLLELRAIIDNLKDRIPLLDEEGDKIIELFKFRIPYYIGPIGKCKKGEEPRFAWAVRKKDDKIYPWNFDDVIDIEESAEKFIRKMTNKCTYLYGEDVLPKESLLYSKFVVLNELNNLRINEEKITVEVKQKIYEEIFCKQKNVKLKQVKDFLVANGICKKTDVLSGVDGDFKGKLNSYNDLSKEKIGIDLSYGDKEKIILNITLFGEEKKILKTRLAKMFPSLSDEVIKRICSLSYMGWGRLSKKFLEEIESVDKNTGEVWNIINTLWNSNENLMQLLSKKYDFISQINDINKPSSKIDLTYQIVEDMNISPAVKRQVWQTLKIIKEIKKIKGKEPSRVFLEVAREKAESEKTKSRKDKLLDLYKSCEDDTRDWIGEINSLEDHRLRSDKLYLYYLQQGKCMYTGENMDLDLVMRDNLLYDKDHIYPESKSMDNSIDNLVLVKKDYNNEKQDVYPIKKEIRDNRASLWKALYIKGFISKKKYERLVRDRELSEGELAGFIERQLVETRQSTKIVSRLLEYALPDTEIVFVKAKNISKFRQDFKFIKVRELNDLHHAKDAYLNIVVGNTYHVKFTRNPANFIANSAEPYRCYNLKRMFDRDVIRNQDNAWIAGDKGTIVTVRETMKRNNILVTRKAYEVKGEFFKQNIVKKGSGQVPIKGSDNRLKDISKYGGYNSAAGAYYVLVESTEIVKDKEKKTRTIEYIPLYLKEYLEKDEANLIEYFKNERGLENPRILISKIKTDALFEVDGFRLWLSGRSGDRLLIKNANQLILDEEYTITLKKVIKYCDRVKINEKLKIYPMDKITDENLIKLYDEFVRKIEESVYGKKLFKQATDLKSKKEIFKDLSIEDKCKLIYEVLHLFQCNSVNANMKLIGGASEAGKLIMGKAIDNSKSINIINQSVTGVYEKKIDLLKL